MQWSNFRKIEQKVKVNTYSRLTGAGTSLAEKMLFISSSTYLAKVWLKRRKDINV